MKKPKVVYSLGGIILTITAFALVGLHFMGVKPAHASALGANTSCTVTFNNPGYPPQTYYVYLDACARRTIASGGNANNFSVVEDDSSWFGTTDPVQVNQDAQRAVRDGINKHLSDFRQDYAACLNTNASLVATDSFGNTFKEFGNPSQLVIDSMPSAQFHSGC